MRHRVLGRTGLSVSEIGLGTVELGMNYGLAIPGEFEQPDQADAIALVQAAVDAGIDFIDTARAYGDAEAVLGQALRGRRDRVVLATKCASFPQGLPGKGELYRSVRTDVETSLRLLAADYVDVLLAHTAPVEAIEQGELWEALEAVRRDGKTRFIGVSTYGEQAPLAAIRAGGWDVLQVAYSLLDRSMARDVFPAAQAAGVGLVIRSVLYRGVLTEKARRLPPDMRPLEPMVNALAFLERPGQQTLAQAALRFVLSHPATGVALVGMRNPAELQQAIGAAGSTLSEEELARIRELASSLNPEQQLRRDKNA